MYREVKVGVNAGTGDPPYVWDVLILDVAYQEAMSFLNEDQYSHVASQVQEMARETDPSHSQVVSVDAVEGFLELREKGGPLGKINVRVFFWLDTRELAGGQRSHAIVILGAKKKESEGQTPVGWRLTMKRRLRKYRNGNYAGNG